MKQIKFTKIVFFMLLVLIIMPFLSLTAYADETDEATADDTDLQIRVETITQRNYSGTALTDRYNITILTAESYEQAKIDALKQEREYLTTQSALFDTDDSRVKDNSVLEIAEQLDLFDESYTLSNITSTQSAKTDNILVTVLLLAIGAGLGCILAILIHKRKDGRTG